MDDETEAQAEVVIEKPKAKAPPVKASPPAPPAPKLPSKIEMLKPFAFYDETGSLHTWSVKQIVEDAADIATIIEKKFPFFKEI